MNAKEKRKALAIHHTDTSDAAWDGPAAKANLKNDGKAAYYRKAFAWVDPEADPDTKAAYKFIHHDVSADGTIGGANIKACQTGIGVLNGGMGGTTIPDADKQGVWDHLAAHIKDAELEPAPMRSLPSGREIRSFEIAELRVDQEDGKPRIRGYAAVFDKWSEPIMGLFKEKISADAFSKAIAKDDVRALFNHDPNYVLWRTKNGTLTLQEDKKGLYMEADPPDTQWARDLQISIGRGDITQMSFAFEVDEDEWNTDYTERNIKSFKRLYDVSPVTFPAYPQTSVKVRCAMTEAGLDCKSLGEVLARRGALTPQDVDTVKKAIEALRTYLPNETPVLPGTPAAGCTVEVDMLKRQLDIIALG